MLSELYADTVKKRYQVIVPRTVTYHLAEGDEDYELLGSARVSVFDSLLHGRSSFADLGDAMYSVKLKDGDESDEDYWEHVFQDKEAFDAANELYRMIKNDRIELKLSNGESILMHQFRYKSYVPISFFGNALKSTPEFLMTPFIWPGTTLNSEMKELKVDTILGPRTVQLLEDMGYATRKNPQKLELQMVM